MAKGLHRLTDRQVKTIKVPGRHADGGGLYLVVDPSGARRWAYMSWKGGKQTEIGLGGAASVSLAVARERAGLCRQAVADGRDPRSALQSVRPVASTFGDVADEMLASLETGWRNGKHRAQWKMTLEVYAAPLRSMDVAKITPDDVLRVLKPIWLTKPETASRLRGRIEKVLDAAKAKGLRTGENPAQWKGNLAHLLPQQQKLIRGHHAAMPWADVPAFVARLRQSNSTTCLALEFVILTAARQGEVIRSVRNGEVMGMRWDEVDPSTKVWTVPAVRMKTGREHRVPLSKRAFEIIEHMAQAKRGPFVFAGQNGKAPLSEMALELQLRRMGAKPATVHGFRSAFRDWVGEATSFPRELAEAALSHVIGDKVERAYRRGDALERRRELMEAWSEYCERIRFKAKAK